jgi:hypothetical protein
MSKIMSVLEKLNLVEKDNPEKTNTSDNDCVYAQEELESKNIDEDNEGKNEDIKFSKKPHIKQNSKFTIQDIYTSNGIENSDINTVFMLENFINALPDSLPAEVRKKSVISIVTSSNTNLNELIGDGVKRLDILKQFSSDYYNSTINTIEEHKQKIAELRNQINNYEDKIQFNETLLKEQSNMIMYEADKILSIINFINNGD